MESELAAELVAMLLADARLPAGGHTQSGSLEPGLADGLGAEDIPAYLQVRLRTVVRVEVGTAVVALHCLRNDDLRNDEPLDAVVDAWAARTASPAMRDTSRLQGRALQRLTSRLWPGSSAVAEVARRDGTPRPVVLAAAAAASGMSPRSLGHVIGYDDVQTVASAALKLVPLDPAIVSGWVLDTLPAVGRLARELAVLTQPAEIPGSAAPQIEAWAQAHAGSTRRLFSA